MADDLVVVLQTKLDPSGAETDLQSLQNKYNGKSPISFPVKANTAQAEKDIQALISKFNNNQTNTINLSVNVNSATNAAQQLNNAAKQVKDTFANIKLGDLANTDALFEKLSKKAKELHQDIKDIQTIRISSINDKDFNALITYNTTLGNTGQLALKAKEGLQELEVVSKRLTQKYNKKAATKLAPTTIPAAREIYGNELTGVQNSLKNAGIETDTLKAKIDNLRTSLAAVGDNDKVALTNWISQFRLLKSEIDAFKSTPEGLGKMLGAEINTGNLQKVRDLLANPAIAQGQTDGVVRLRNELIALQDGYTQATESLSRFNEESTTGDLLKVSTDVDALDKRLQSASKSAELFNGSVDSNQKLQNAANQIEKLKLVVQDYEKQYADAIKRSPELQADVDTLNKHLENADAISLKTLRSEIQDVGAKLKTASGESLSFSKSLQQSLQDSGIIGRSIAQVFSGYKLFQTATRTIKNMVTEVQNIDASLLELRKVTGLSGEALDEFTDSAFKSGQQLGRTGQDVIDAVATFSRAGYTLQEANELAQAALVMTNIGPDINSTADAASAMISILKAYKIEAEDAMKAIDVLYNVSNLEPVDFGNLNDMLVTAGGTLAQTGTSLEETVAMLTGAFATMRNPEVSRGLIMISQRLRAVDEDGQAIEGLAPKLAAEFKDIGIDIEDSNGNLRSTYDILNDLAAVWDSLSSKQRQMIGEDVAGNRQVRTLNALMGNWDVVQSSLVDANQALGTAMEGNAMFEESIQGRINKLTSAFQELATTTVDSGLVKWFIDAGTAIVTLTTNIGGLQTVLLPVLAIIGVAQWNNFTKIITGIGKAFQTSTGSLSAFRIGLSGVIAILGIAVAAYQAYRSNIEESRRASIEAGQAAADQAKKLSASYNEYKELSSMTNRTAEQEKAMKDALDATTDALGAKATALEGLTEGSDEYLRKLEELTQQELLLARTSVRYALQSATDKALDRGASPFAWMSPRKTMSTAAASAYGFDKDAADYVEDVLTNTLNKGIERVSIRNPGNSRTFDFRPEKFFGRNDYLDDYYQFQAAQVELDKTIAQLNKDGQSNVADIITASEPYKYIGQYLSQEKSNVEAIIDGMVQLDVVNAQIEGTIPKTTDDLDEFVDKMVSASGATGLYADALREAYKDAIYIPVEVVPKSSNGGGGGEESTKITTKTTIDEAALSLFSQKEAYEGLTKAMEEQNKQGVLSFETYKKLVDLGDDYVKMLKLTADGYVLDTDKLEEFIEKQDENLRNLALYKIDALQPLADTGDSAAQKELDQWVALKREIDNATSALSRWRKANETPDEDSELHEYQSMYKDYSEALKNGKVGTDQFQEATTAILGEGWQDRYGSRKEAYEDAQKKLKRYSGSGNKNEDAKAADNFLKDLQKNGLVTVDANGAITTDKTAEEIAESLGISTDLVLAAFKNWNTFNDENKFEFPELLSEEDKKKADTFAEEAATVESTVSTYESALERWKKVREQFFGRDKSGTESPDGGEGNNGEPQTKEHGSWIDNLIHQAEEAAGGKWDVSSVAIQMAAQTLIEAEDSWLNKSIEYQDALTTGIESDIQRSADLLKAAETAMDEAYNNLYNLLNPQPNTPTPGEHDPDDPNAKGVRSKGNTGNNGWVVGNVDMAHRPQIPVSHLSDVGWDDVGPNGNYATLFSQTYSAGDTSQGYDYEYPENVVMNVTPILPNGDVLEPEALEEYLAGLVASGDILESDKPENGGLGLVLSVDQVEGALEDAYIAAEEFTERLHNEQADFYGGGNGNGGGDTPAPTSGPISKKGQRLFSDTYDVQDEHGSMYGTGSAVRVADDVVESFDETDTAAAGLASALVGYTQTINNLNPGDGGDGGNGDVDPAGHAQEIRDHGIKGSVGGQGHKDMIMEAQSLAKSLGQAGDNLGAKALKDDAKALSEAGSDLESAATAFATAEPNTEQYEIASQKLDTATENFQTAYKNLQEKIDSTKAKISVSADTTQAKKDIAELDNIEIKPKVKPDLNGGIQQDADGTLNAKAGLAIVDDGTGAKAGPELVLHNKRGTFELGSGNGPRFTTLDNGDTVYTARQTRSILSRLGKVGGFFKNGLNNTRAFFGKAFATGIGGSGSAYWINQVLNQVTGGGNGRTGSGNNGRNNGGGGGNSFKKFQKWFKKLFDWVEIRLARLQTVTDAWITKANEAIGYIARNRELDHALESIENQIRNTAAGYEEYMETAEEVGRRAGLSADIIRKIQEGEIDVASYSQKMQEKIRAYQEWYEKAQDCVEALSELREQERELAGQKLDNILNHYQWRVDRLDAIVSYDAKQIELMNALGDEIFESNYNRSIDSTRKKLEELLASREAYNREFASLVERGLIERESEMWYDYIGKLEQLDESIIQTRIDLQDLIDTADDVSLTKLQYAMSAIQEAASAVSRMMDLHEAQGIDNLATDYEKLIRNGMEQIDNLEKQNEELREQQRGLDVLSEKYQDLQDQINSNLDAISQMKVQQEEWNDAVLDLKIAQLEKYKEQLQKTNDQYERQKELQQALEELEKARSQRTIRVYRGADAGFVYEADQDALRSAQENLESVIQNQLIGKIDELIEAIEDAKNDTNVYDANGVLLGSEYQLPNIASYADLLRAYSENDDVLTAAMEDARRAAYDSIMGSVSNIANSPVITIGDIVVQGVDDVEAFANAIREQFPNAILQSLYSKP